MVNGTKLEWALWAVAHTPFHVFQLVENGKDPITSCYDATRDVERITALWTANPNANIGYAYFLSGHAVVDLDRKDPEKDGVETWRKLIAEHGETRTLTYATVNNGFHLVYHDPDGYLQTKQQVWPGIDTRANGGYGVGLGSVIDGKTYTVADDSPIAALPEWCKSGRKTKAERQEMRRSNGGVAEDTPLAIEAGREAIRIELAQKGEPRILDGSDGRCWELCAWLLDYGLADATILDMLKEYWQPAFDLDWYALKLRNAHAHRENAVGCDRPISMAEKYQMLATPGLQQHIEAVKAEQKAKRRKKYPFRTPAEAATAPPLTYWDENKCLPRMEGGCAVVAYGPMSSHKTGVVLKFCLDAVFHKDAKVLYLAPEGAYGINTARLPDAVRDRNHQLTDLDGRWYTFSHAPGLMDDAEVDELIAACREEGFEPDVITIDTLTRAAKGFDISAPATGVGLIVGMERLAEAFNASVIAITHPGKDGSKGSIGSSLVESLAYAIWHIEAEEAGDRQWDVNLHVKKMKDGPQDFHLAFVSKAEEGHAPVVSGGNRVDKSVTAKRRGKPLDMQKWGPLRSRVIERLKLVPEGEFIRAGILANDVEDARLADEGPGSRGKRVDNCERDLKKEAISPSGYLHDLIVTTENGSVVDQLEGLRWRLPPHLR